VNAPRIEIDLDKIEHNTRCLVQQLAARDVRVLGVTKASLGSPGVAAAMMRGGAVALGDSRVENLARLSGVSEPAARTLIRSPMLSQVAPVVRTAGVSLNTEASVIAALDRAAARARIRHGVILMVELGDLREGIAVDEVPEAVRTVLRCRSLVLVGLGANLACQSGVVPADANMDVLHRLVDRTEADRRVRLSTISGGNSASLEWALTTDRLERTNELRLGESILLGTEPLGRTRIPGLHGDAFTLVGEVIESAEKPRQPWGGLAQAAYGAPARRTGHGTVRQAIVALGRQDVDISGLVPPTGVDILGMSSDHLVLDTGDRDLSVGDELRFGLTYGALVRAMTSPFVTQVERAPSSEPNGNEGFCATERYAATPASGFAWRGWVGSLGKRG
jgi:predicted amino acid racemase